MSCALALFIACTLPTVEYRGPPRDDAGCRSSLTCAPHGSREDSEVHGILDRPKLSQNRNTLVNITVGRRTPSCKRHLHHCMAKLILRTL